MIEGRLQEMGHEPCNVQVIVQGTGEHAILYLVDDSGVIRKIDGGNHEVASRDVGNESEAEVERPQAVSVGQEEIIGSQRGTVSDDEVELRDGRSREELEAELERLRGVIEEQKETLEGQSETIRDLEDRVSEAKSAITTLTESHEKEVEDLQAEIAREKQRLKRFWKLRCEMMSAHEELLNEKDDEITLLKAELNAEHSRNTTKTVKSASLSVRGSRCSDRSTSLEVKDNELETSQVNHGRLVRGRGKAPPVDPFTGEQPDVLWEDWLPTFERASTWNDWSESEKLLQLAGHLRGKALQEWSLLGVDATKDFKTAVASLQDRLDPGGPALAAQDFRHLTQQHGETVADLIRRLESVFRRAYGREKLSVEMRDALLYGQLQEGLKYDLLKSPAVSGARTYKELCISAKTEERRQSELLKRQQYHQQSSTKPLKNSDDKDDHQSGRGSREIKVLLEL